MQGKEKYSHVSVWKAYTPAGQTLLQRVQETSGGTSTSQATIRQAQAAPMHPLRHYAPTGRQNNSLFYRMPKTTFESELY